MKEVDFLVIGSGISGLSFALKAARNGRVAIVTKSSASESNTRYAQGGIACVLSPDDDASIHIQDTLESGAGLCNKEAVTTMVLEAPSCINELLELGVSFSRQNGRLELGREGGHSRNRILHHQDRTGQEIEQTLLRAVKHHPNIALYENHFALDLIITQEGRRKICHGAYVLDAAAGRTTPFISGNTIVCSGGAGQVYRHTTNPAIATGDGIAMAYRAGAEVADLEFFQFHPTTLLTHDGNNLLLTEALRGAGAELVNNSGIAFMSSYHPLGSLAPRDIVARSIVAEMEKTNHPSVYLDTTRCGEENLRNNFTKAYETCQKAGFDIARDRIPVVPAAHYLCGGIKTDLDGRTNIQGLYAFGEVACTGVHGANRLASNSLLEALVFSNRAYNDVVKSASADSKSINLDPDFFTVKPIPDYQEIIELRESVKDLMWEFAGIRRNSGQLQHAMNAIRLIEIAAEKIYTFYRRIPESAELYNMCTAARLILSHALARPISRGLHFIQESPAEA